MNKNQKLKIKNQNYGASICFIIITVSLMFVSAAFASGGGGEHHFTWMDWLWPLVNFAVLVAILVFFSRKPVVEYFKKRTELIENSLKEASEAKELAQKTLNEVRGRLKTTDSEIEQILAAAKKSGEKEKEAIIAEGVRLKEKILEQAKANIDFELQKAREKIKADAALLALDLAEKQIKEKLGKKEQEVLIDDYIKRLEAKN
ncbi:MAG TPA: ATP synthase F0 subunit B [Nitrospirae bacterium]|nr:ATP synthase F0 subunit B [Nitrospirota bacterium]